MKLAIVREMWSRYTSTISGTLAEGIRRSIQEGRNEANHLVGIIGKAQGGIFLLICKRTPTFAGHAPGYIFCLGAGARGICQQAQVLNLLGDLAGHRFDQLFIAIR